MAVGDPGEKSQSPAGLQKEGQDGGERLLGTSTELGAPQRGDWESLLPASSGSGDSQRAGITKGCICGADGNAS